MRRVRATALAAMIATVASADAVAESETVIGDLLISGIESCTDMDRSAMLDEFKRFRAIAQLCGSTGLFDSAWDRCHALEIWAEDYLVQRLVGADDIQMTCEDVRDWVEGAIAAFSNGLEK